MSRLLTIAEFSTAYGVSRSRTYLLLASGDLSGVKVGRTTRIPLESAESWKASLPTFRSAIVTTSVAA